MGDGRLPAAYPALTDRLLSGPIGVAYNRRPMAKRSSPQRDAERRAEARRRARLAAQGRVADEGEEQDEVAVARARPTSLPLLQRFFPPAASLPGKPDPLAGFTYTGALRPVVQALWLIPRNLYAGIGMGVLWAASYVITVQYAGTLVGTIASFVSFGSLVAAGWLGWQRPWLYGFVAAVLGYLLYAAYILYIFAGDPSIATPGAKSGLATYLLVNGLLQAGIGALAGFYGGYLRRRLADPATRQASSARRRR
jgi:hypothetical protein